EIAKLCLQNGANANEGLDYSISRSNSAMIGICLQNGAQSSKALDYAVSRNDIGLATELLDKYSVDPNAMLKKSILHKKITSADPEQTGTSGTNTQNDVQAINGVMPITDPNLEIAEIALQRKADPNPYVKSAISAKNNDLITLLLKYDADASVVL